MNSRNKASLSDSDSDSGEVAVPNQPVEETASAKGHPGEIGRPGFQSSSA